MALSVEHILACLWGATIVKIDISPDLAELTLHCKVLDKGNLCTHVLTLHEVATINFSRHTPLPWDYCELTAIEVEDKEGEWQVSMELWQEANRLQVSCRQILLNDAVLKK